MREEIVSAAKDAVQEINPFKYLSKAKIETIVNGLVMLGVGFLAIAKTNGGDLQFSAGENGKWFKFNMNVDKPDKQTDNEHKTEIIDGDAKEIF